MCMASDSGGQLGPEAPRRRGDRPTAEPPSSFQRKRTLLVEYEAAKRSNTFVDRRFGDAEAGMTESERALLLLQRQRVREARDAAFALGDDDGAAPSLTHLGRSLADDDYGAGTYAGGESDGDDGDGVDADDHFGGGLFDRAPARGDPGEPRRKTKKEVMDEIMAKSKAAKAAKAAARNADAGATAELDAAFAAVAAAGGLAGRVRQGKGERVAVPAGDAAYDALRRELAAGGQRSAPADPPPAEGGDGGADASRAAATTAAEGGSAREAALAATAAGGGFAARRARAALADLAAARKAAARAQGPGGDDLDDDDDGSESGSGSDRGDNDDGPVAAGGASASGAALRRGGDSSDQLQARLAATMKAMMKKHGIEAPEDGEGDEEEEGEESGDGESGSDSGETASGSGSGSDDEDDGEGGAGEPAVESEEEEEAAAAAPPSRADPSPADTLTLADFRAAVLPAMDAACTSGDLDPVGDAVASLRRGPGAARARAQAALAHAVRAYADEASRPGGCRLPALDALARQVGVLAAAAPYYASAVARARISRAATRLAASLATASGATELDEVAKADPTAWPDGRDAALLRLWCAVFPLGDRARGGHPVAGPGAALAGAYLALCPVGNGRDVASGLFVAATLARWCAGAAPHPAWAPEAAAFAADVVAASAGAPTVGRWRVKGWPAVAEMKGAAPPLPASAALGRRAGASPPPAPAPASCLVAALAVLTEVAAGAAGAPAADAALERARAAVAALLSAAPPPKLREAAEVTKAAIESAIAATLATRKPLTRPKRGAAAAGAQTLNPRVDADFAPGRDADPDRDRASQRALKRAVARETRGAMRELRKDAAAVGAARAADAATAKAARRAAGRAGLAMMEAQEADFRSGGNKGNWKRGGKQK